jgi:hypothetical protein
MAPQPRGGASKPPRAARAGAPAPRSRPAAQRGWRRPHPGARAPAGARVRGGHAQGPHGPIGIGRVRERGTGHRTPPHARRADAPMLLPPFQTPSRVSIALPCGCHSGVKWGYCRYLRATGDRINSDVRQGGVERHSDLAANTVPVGQALSSLEAQVCDCSSKWTGGRRAIEGIAWDGGPPCRRHVTTMAWPSNDSKYRSTRRRTALYFRTGDMCSTPRRVNRPCPWVTA